MLKNVLKLQLVIEGREYQFTIEPDAPLQHVKEAIFQYMKYVGQIEDNHLAQQKEQERAQYEEEPLEKTPEA